MSSVAGVLTAGEASKTARAIGQRQRGSIYFFYLVMFGGAAGLAAAGYFLLPFTHLVDAATGLFIGWVVGIVAYVFFCRPLAVALFRKRMVSRGLPLDLPLHMEIAPEALVYELGAVRHTAQWSAVTELFSKGGYWIFLVQTTPYFAPKRFFADAAQEKAFVRDALSHMSEAARGNSADATAFAA